MELKAFELKTGCGVAASICFLSIFICVALDSDVAWALAGIFFSVLVFTVPAYFLMHPNVTRGNDHSAVESQTLDEVNETAGASSTRPIATVL